MAQGRGAVGRVDGDLTVLAPQLGDEWREPRKLLGDELRILLGAREVRHCPSQRKPRRLIGHQQRNPQRLLEIAGAEPADLRVMVEARRLYIVGRRYDRERDLRGSVLLKEIAYGDFAKKVHLPVPVAYDEATASYRDGILTIRLPVSERAALPQHRTEIRMTVRRVPA